MAGGRQLLEARLGGLEGFAGLVQVALVEQRPAESELGVANLVEVVSAAVEELERVTRLRLGLLELAGAEMHLCERRDSLGRRGGIAEVERDPEGVLQEADRA